MGTGGTQAGGQPELRADTHQGSHTWDPHGQGVALLQRPGCGLEGVSREGVGQGPNPVHKARLGFGGLLVMLLSWSRGWVGFGGKERKADQRERGAGEAGAVSRVGKWLPKLHHKFAGDSGHSLSPLTNGERRLNYDGSLWKSCWAFPVPELWLAELWLPLANSQAAWVANLLPREGLPAPLMVDT